MALITPAAAGATARASRGEAPDQAIRQASAAMAAASALMARRG